MVCEDELLDAFRNENPFIGNSHLSSIKIAGQKQAFWQLRSVFLVMPGGWGPYLGLKAKIVADKQFELKEFLADTILIRRQRRTLQISTQFLLGHRHLDGIFKYVAVHSPLNSGLLAGHAIKARPQPSHVVGMFETLISNFFMTKHGGFIGIKKLRKKFQKLFS